MSLVRIKLKHDTAANFTASNIVLLLNEMGIEIDTQVDAGGFRYVKAKLGNGVTAWNDLPYFRLSAIGGGSGATTFIELTDVPGSYSGQGGKYLKVNEAEGAIEFEVIEADDLPAGIDAVKIGDGSVSNAEFQRLDATSSIQTQLDGKQASGNYFNKSSDDTDDITVGLAKFVTQAQKDKIDNITITQAVDLDAIETRVNELDASVILKGTWDVSSGVFPGGGVAQAGWSYIVSVGSTLDGIQFSVNDRIIAITDNASTTTFAANWFKADYTDLVTAVDGNTGNLTLGAIIAALSSKTTPVDADTIALSDSEAANASKKLSWANIKATLKTYFDTLYQAISSVLTDLTTKWTPASASSAASLQFHEDTDNGTNKITVTAPAALAGDWTLTLPDTNGDADQVLKTDGNGVTSWVTPSGGALTNWTEARTASAPNATVPVVSFVPNTADTNNDSVLGAKGTGAILAQIPDSTTTGGNKRGVYAVDWQRSRGAAAHVAAGAYSVISGGLRNKAVDTGSVIAGGTDNAATGDYSTVSGGTTNSCTSYSGVIGGGNTNTALSAYGMIGGGRNNTIPVNTDFVDSYNAILGGAFNVIADKVINGAILGGRANTLAGKHGQVGGFEAAQTLFGQRSFAAGSLTSVGDRQHGDLTWGRSITGTAATELFLDAASLQALIGSNRAWNFEISVIAIVKTVGNGTVTLGDTHGSNYVGTIQNIGGTTALVGGIEQVGTDRNTTNMAGCDVTITADNTNDALKITFTPATLAGSTTVTLVNAVAKITEIAY